MQFPTGGTFQILSLSRKPLPEGVTNKRLEITSLQSGRPVLRAPARRPFVEVYQGVEGTGNENM
ncbi:MAG: hypothetical protein OXH57_01795 [Ekhidna sp.]|nr:hypothetical protein [Ekhidna sp.]